MPFEAKNHIIDKIFLKSKLNPFIAIVSILLHTKCFLSNLSSTKKYLPYFKTDDRLITMK